MDNKEKMKCQFLRVSDIQMAQYLNNLGYQCITSDGKTWTYINTNKYLFTDERIVYTNILCV